MATSPVVLGRHALRERPLAGRFSQLEQSSPGDDRRAVGGGGALRFVPEVEQHDGLEPRRAAVRRQELAQRRAVVGDRDRRLGVIEHVGTLLRGVGDEDAGGDRSGDDRGEVGDRPLRSIRRQDGEAGSRHDAKVHEPRGSAEDRGPVFAPRDRLPAGRPLAAPALGGPRIPWRRARAPRSPSPRELSSWDRDASTEGDAARSPAHTDRSPRRPAVDGDCDGTAQNRKTAPARTSMSSSMSS